MKAEELVHNKMYKVKGSLPALYKYREGKKYWFTHGLGSFWMNLEQVETLITEEL